MFTRCTHHHHPTPILEPIPEPIPEPEPPKKFTVSLKGVRYTFNEDAQLHSFDDKPAISSDEYTVVTKGNKSWTLHNDLQYHYDSGLIHRDGPIPAIYDAYNWEGSDRYRGSYAFVKHGLAHNPNHSTYALYNQKSEIAVSCENGLLHGDILFARYNKGFRFNKGEQTNVGYDGWYDVFIQNNKIGMPRNPCTDVKEFMEFVDPGPGILGSA